MLYLHQNPKTDEMIKRYIMKKHAVIFAASLLMLPAMLKAQEAQTFVFDQDDDELIEAVRPVEDKMIFNHWALGVAPTDPSTVIIPNVATCITPYVQLRLGFDLFPSLSYSGLTGKTVHINEFQFGDAKYSADFDGKFHMSGMKFLVDIYPGKTTPFHFTVGLMGAVFSGGRIADIYTAKPFLTDEKDWQNTGILVKDNTYRISTDATGQLKFSLKTNPVCPYFGIGFGRAFREDRRVRVMFDMGVMYSGGIRASALSQPRTPVGYDKLNLERLEFSSADMAGYDEITKDMVDLSKYGLEQPLPVLDFVRAVSMFDPYLKVTIFIQIK